MGFVGASIAISASISTLSPSKKCGAAPYDFLVDDPFQVSSLFQYRAIRAPIGKGRSLVFGVASFAPPGLVDVSRSRTHGLRRWAAFFRSFGACARHYSFAPSELALVTVFSLLRSLGPSLMRSAREDSIPDLDYHLGICDMDHCFRIHFIPTIGMIPACVRPDSMGEAADGTSAAAKRRKSAAHSASRGWAARIMSSSGGAKEDVAHIWKYPVAFHLFDPR